MFEADSAARGLVEAGTRKPDLVILDLGLPDRDGVGEDTHYLRVYMTGLRRKLEADPARPAHLRTETGVGYRLLLDGSEGA